jgi:hypothetical protein
MAMGTVWHNPEQMNRRAFIGAMIGHQTPQGTAPNGVETVRLLPHAVR